MDNVLLGYIQGRWIPPPGNYLHPSPWWLSGSSISAHKSKVVVVKTMPPKIVVSKKAQN
jgi:hypothetical protein